MILNVISSSYSLKHLQLRELSQRVWQGGQLVVGEIQFCQLCELSQRVWQGGQLVVGEIQCCQLRELSQRVWQGGQLVAGEIQFCQLRELSQRGWQIRLTSMLHGGQVPLRPIAGLVGFFVRLRGRV